MRVECAIQSNLSCKSAPAVQQQNHIFCAIALYDVSMWNRRNKIKKTNRQNGNEKIKWSKVIVWMNDYLVFFNFISIIHTNIEYLSIYLIIFGWCWRCSRCGRRLPLYSYTVYNAHCFFFILFSARALLYTRYLLNCCASVRCFFLCIAFAIFAFCANVRFS